MKEKRCYQRYTISDAERDALPAEIKLDGRPVGLVDFSLGGLCVLSEKPYARENIVNISVTLGERGRIDLIGRVVRVVQMEKTWSVAIDLSKNYQMNSLRKK